MQSAPAAPLPSLWGLRIQRNCSEKTDFDFWSPQTAQEAFRDEQQIIRTGQPMIGKIEKLTHPDGRVSWDYTTKLPLKDSQGRIIGICDVAFPIRAKRLYPSFHRRAL
ncbi:MAG: PAS domain-containing protein [Verrucomicrobia bacterium]|nr:PAS domain-containing protein [Verrucomicrobiota bacterium]